MDGAITQVSVLIKQEIDNRDCLPGDEFSVALYQLYITPDACDPRAVLEALSPKVQSQTYLNQLPAERFIELLTLMHVLEKRVASSAIFTDFHEVIAEIGVRQIHQAEWSFLGGAASILTYFTLSGGADTRSSYLEKLLKAFDTVFATGMTTAALGRKVGDFISNYSLATGITGLLIALVKACQHQKNNERIKGTVQNVAHWIETRMHVLSSNIIDVNWESKNLSFFPASIEQDSDLVQVDNVLNWADGDLGHVFLLYLAAEFWQNSTYYRIAERIGTYTLLRKDFTSTGINHADFKKGSAGLMYTYDALWRSSGNSKYQQGAAFWHQQTADLLAKDILDDYYHQTFFGILDGVVGTALLEHAVTKGTGREDWMDMMLL